MNTEKLLHFVTLKAPWAVTVSCDVGVLRGIVEHWRTVQTDVRLVELEGKRMRSKASFYDEFIQQFKFPSYFGRNLNALSECLVDPAVLGGKGFAIFVYDGNQWLADEPPEMLAGVLDVLSNTGEELSEPVDMGQPWDRPAAPFHVLIQTNDPKGALGELPVFNL